MDDNYFDPEMFMGPDDPFRSWASQLESNPDLLKLMATDPQGAAKKMSELGIPPPPGDLKAYTDGMGGDPSPVPLPGAVYGGATPPAPAPVPREVTPPLPQAPAPNSPFDRITRLLGSTWGPQGGPPTDGPSDVPLPQADPRKALGAALDPVPVPAPAPASEMLEPEVNPSAGQPLIPRPRPAEAGPTDVSAQSRTGEALSGFSKSLQGVKPVPGPPPNYVSTPSVRSPGSISAPNLQNLLSLVGQGPPSPMALTLGRLLATGKA